MEAFYLLGTNQHDIINDLFSDSHIHQNQDSMLPFESRLNEFRPCQAHSQIDTEIQKEPQDKQEFDWVWEDGRIEQISNNSHQNSCKGSVQTKNEIVIEINSIDFDEIRKARQSQELRLLQLWDKNEKSIWNDKLFQKRKKSKKISKIQVCQKYKDTTQSNRKIKHKSK